MSVRSPTGVTYIMPADMTEDELRAHEEEASARRRAPGGKYSTEPTWEEPCAVCKKPVVMCNARNEVIGNCHTGCHGYPFCGCAQRHEGECSDQPEP